MFHKSYRIAISIITLTIAPLVQAQTTTNSSFTRVATKEQSSGKKTASRKPRQQVIVIKLPQTGSTKNLVDGYTLNSIGAIKNAQGKTLAILNDSGIFTNPRGEAYSKSMQLKLLGLMGTGLDFNSTVADRTGPAPTTVAPRSTEEVLHPATIARAPSAATPIANPSMTTSAWQKSPSIALPGTGITANNHYQDAKESLLPTSVPSTKSSGSTLTTPAITNRTAVSTPTEEYKAIFGDYLCNSVQTVVEDMTLENDSQLDGIPAFRWATGPNPAAIMMGANPRGANMQAWWREMPNVLTEYKDDDLWTAYVQWFLIFEGVGNRANNVRVEIRNAHTYYLSRATNTWHLVGESVGSHWFQATKSNLLWANDNVDQRIAPDGSVAIKIPENSPNVYHGIWEPGKIDISSIVGDMSALFTTVEARIVVDDPTQPDDRNLANLLLHVGGDYYPDMNANAGNAFPPAAGVSRAKRITNQWQAFNFATIDAARQDYQGGSAAIPTNQFRSNPPPLALTCR
ncbi:MAG: hypothetical protein ACOYNL_10610 [Rickettsiales bacterium]